MKRIGRGLAAISSTASMKLTWLHTSTAAPLRRDVLVAADTEAVDEARQQPRHEAQQVFGHQHEDVEGHHRVGDAGEQEDLRNGEARRSSSAPAITELAIMNSALRMLLAAMMRARCVGWLRSWISAYIGTL